MRYSRYDQGKCSVLRSANFRTECLLPYSDGIPRWQSLPPCTVASSFPSDRKCCRPCGSRDRRLLPQSAFWQAETIVCLHLSGGQSEAFCQCLSKSENQHCGLSRTKGSW